jgi:nucleoside phosphorylase
LLFTQIKSYRIKSQLATQTNQNISVILTTFGVQDSKGVWQGEVAPYLDNLKNPIDISSKLSSCDKAFSGKIENQNVLVVVTGMGKLKTSTCTNQILQNYGESVNEIFLSGIAGFSTSITQNSVVEPVMIGDLCINSISLDFDLQYYGADQQDTTAPSPMFWHRETGTSPNKIDLDQKLSVELYNSILSQNLNPNNLNADEINKKYHSTTRTPKTYSNSQCLEVSSDLFWHDTQADLRARQIGSEWLNQSRKLNTSPENIVVASSMESVAVGSSIISWNSSHSKPISFAYVRAASNFDHPPTNSSNTPLINSKISLETGYSPESEKLALFTQSQPVIQLLKIRNK